MTDEAPIEAQNDLPQATSSEGAKAFFIDLVKFTLLALLIVAPIRWFIAQPFIVNGSSMDPTFKDGDYLIVDELSYYFHEPQRGDVVIFRYPKDTSKYFIKRIVGLPGETFKLVDGHPFVVQSKNATPKEILEPYLTFTAVNNLQTTLVADEYFVMGDNRPASSDSRFWGPVPRKNITGNVFVRLYPLSQIALHPGKIN